MGVRNRMEMAKELVEENTRRAQAKQKAYYDQKTKELNLQLGDKVLLLLLSSTKKICSPMARAIRGHKMHEKSKLRDSDA